ncbi:MAG: CHAT domain-containing protein [Pleurocapsa sp.]
MRSPVFHVTIYLSLVVSSLTIDLPFNNSQAVYGQSINSRQTEAERYYQEARFQLEQSSLLAAKIKFEQALQIYQAINDASGKQNCLIGLARVDYELGNYRGAQTKLQQAQILNSDRNGRLLSLKGLIFIELGDYKQALSNLRTGVHYLQVANSGDRLSRQELNEARIALGEVYIYWGQYQQASVMLQSTMNSASDLHLKRRALNALGTISLELGQYPTALDIFQEAASLPNTVGDTIGKAQTLENLGRAYRELGNKKQALKYYQDALEQLRGIGAWSQQVFVLNHLGVLATDLGLSNRALEYFQDAEGRLSNTGGVGRVLTLTNLGYYYSQKQDYQKATDYLERALAWARQNGDRIGEAKARNGLGEIELRSGNGNGAIAHLTSSVDIFESLRPGLRDEEKISLLEIQAYTYDLLQQAYVAEEKHPEALIAAERGRARAFIELLAKRLSSNPHLESTIEAPTLKQITTVAQSRQATLVSYSIIKDRDRQESELYIWVVNPQGEITFRRLDLAVIEEEFRTNLTDISSNARQAASGGLDIKKPRLQNFVVSMRGQMTDTQPRTKLSFPHDAYKLLIEPIADLLPQDAQQPVIFIPQGSLFLLPFPALQNADGEFLIERHTIQIAPSIQVLAIQNPSVTSLDTASALVVGNPQPMPQALQSLPGAELEAKTIAQMLDVSPLLGEAATEDTVTQQMSQAKLIHLATHGLFDEQQGLQSSLAFADTESGDGFLTAEEILDLKLNADLVVLSACNTGRGTITGDGVVGLSRSFLLAGAQTTMVSLWYVPDLPTASLMTKFYENLKTQPNKAQALRQAMLAVMEETPNPRDWAAFVLVGN